MLNGALWWNCLNYREWQMISFCRSAMTLPLAAVVPDAVMTVFRVLSGIDDQAQRFEAFTGTYRLTYIETPEPPPFDKIWVGDLALWNEMNAVVIENGTPPEICNCEFWAFKGSQGAAWPTCWP